MRAHWGVVVALMSVIAGLAGAQGISAASPTPAPVAPCAAVSGTAGDLSPAALAPGPVHRLTNRAAANVTSVVGALGPNTVVGLVPVERNAAEEITFYSPEIINVAADTLKALPGGLVYQGLNALAVTDGVAVFPQSQTITTAYGSSGQTVWSGLYGGAAAGDVLVGNVVTEARTGQVLGQLVTNDPGYLTDGLGALACAGSTLYNATYVRTDKGSVAVTVSAWSLPYGAPLWTTSFTLPVQPGYAFKPTEPTAEAAVLATPEGALVVGSAPYAAVVMLGANTGDVLWRRSGVGLKAEAGPDGQIAVESGDGPVEVLAALSGKTVRTLPAVPGTTLAGASAEDLVLAGGGRLAVEGWHGQDRRLFAGPGGAVQVFAASGGVYAVGLTRGRNGTTLATETLASPRPAAPYHLPTTPWRLAQTLRLPGQGLVGGLSANGRALYLASDQTDRLYVIDPGERAVGSIALPDMPLSIANNAGAIAVALAGCASGAPAACTGPGHVLIAPIGYGAALSRLTTTLLTTKDPRPLVAAVPNSNNFAIADGTAGELRVVNDYEGQPVATVPLPAGTWAALSVAPTGSQALISDASSSQVLPVNLVSFKALQALPSNVGTPGAIAITPNGSYAYVEQVSSEKWVSPAVEQISLRRDTVSGGMQLNAPGPFALSGTFDSLVAGRTGQNVVDVLPTPSTFDAPFAMTNWLRLGPVWAGGISGVATAFGGAQAIVVARGIVAAVDMRTGDLDQTLLSGLPPGEGPGGVSTATDAPVAAAWVGSKVWIWTMPPPG